MGLILMVMWLGAFCVLGMPPLVVSIIVVVKSERSRVFWWALSIAAGVSILLQYVAIFAPVVQRGEYSLDLLHDMVWGWHLLVPVIAALTLCALGRMLRQPGIRGAAAGLFLSVTGTIALALPVLFTFPEILHLRFIP